MERINRKIAVITITMNDNYKILEWKKWYSEYQKEIGCFIIVDNNSDLNYKRVLFDSFPEANIIELDHNAGCTGAYNEGIKFALLDKTITHIALVGNDIRLEQGAFNACAELLDSNDSLGMVAPVLLEANSDIVADFGCKISKKLTMQPYGVGVRVDNLVETIRYCDAVTGGINVSKREFYEKVGLQDDNLFMYSDEIDMGIRAKKNGYRLAVLRNAKSWHQHIHSTKTGRRHPFSKFLIGRNKVYLAKKHFGFGRAVFVALYFIAINIKVYTKGFLNNDRASIIDTKWQIIGVIKGLFGDMRPNKYSSM